MTLVNCSFCGKQHKKIPWNIHDIEQQAVHTVLTDDDLLEIYNVIVNELKSRGWCVRARKITKQLTAA